VAELAGGLQRQNVRPEQLSRPNSVPAAATSQSSKARRLRHIWIT
jgi:hypothetical protein